ncbi:Predicted nuclease of the RNAse H fold, HicB family [Lutimaribacter pacificus]|uniref:Predicted nuclease of the RNAse H fold, HicB family n=1 Tax=Lutimaribacter pacificus TaxID=391948 RepID=A0A1H0G974_9RHOB|nr:type II toxin-antitoxin system HicB family antitoxin [Lutimaribacter pacificus]SDO03455.1 Predicted nuclease of the RNAse H fold, HicB family [Lutimaribacter pacificus]SHJ86195.1 Predicted nuclease of the RNAse H fold, HicB family [Lutimaribacter pacificus]
MDEYLVVVVPLSDEDGGGYLGIAPDLQGCMSDGETREDAVRNVEAAIAEWINAQKKRGVAIPKPGAAGERANERQKSLLKALKALTDYVDHADGRIRDLERALEEAIRRVPDWEASLPLFLAAGGSAHSVTTGQH